MALPQEITTTACSTCATSGWEKIRCRSCAGRGYFINSELPGVVGEDRVNQTYTVTEEAMGMVQDIMRYGLTREEHSRLLDWAVGEARLQGRVDVGVRQIAERLHERANEII